MKAGLRTLTIVWVVRIGLSQPVLRLLFLWVFNLNQCLRIFMKLQKVSHIKGPLKVRDACIYLFGVLRRFQHCTGHITTGSWKGRGNQYIQFVGVLYCQLPTNGKQLPTFPLEAVPGTEPRPQRWEARVLPLCHRGPEMPVSQIISQMAKINHRNTLC